MHLHEISQWVVHRLPLLLGMLIPSTSVLAETAEESDEWDLILQESNELEAWSADPTADILLDIFPVIWTSELTFALSRGYSDNYLRRSSDISSAYTGLSGEWFLSRLGEIHNFNLFLYLDQQFYERVQAPDETVAYLFGQWRPLNKPLHTEVSVLYIDQIYDASLTDLSGPAPDNLRQWRGEVAFTAFRNLRPNLRVEGGPSLLFVTYPDLEEDYLQAALALKLKWDWRPTISLITHLDGEHDRFADRLPRDESGSDLPDSSPLRRNTLSLGQDIGWTPAFLEGLELGAGLEWEMIRGTEGTYDDRENLSFDLTVKYTWKSLGFRLEGSLEESEFPGRTVSLPLEPDPILRRRAESISFEVDWEINDSLSARLIAESERLSSRESSDEYTENRLSLGLEMTY